MNFGRLKGKVILVTGGSRGIGRQIVLAAVEQGARVVLCARNISQEVWNVEEEVARRRCEGEAIAIRADVSQEDDVEALFDATLNTFGRVDIVVSNAAISQAQLLVSLSTEAWNEVIATNLTGAFLVARRAVKEFLRGEGGRIVFIGSIAQNGAPANVSYAASKGGLAGLAHSIAGEYEEQRVHTSLVVVGSVDTEMARQAPSSLRQLVTTLCPQRRMASVTEIAAVVLFLATHELPGLNGKAIYASGGLVDLPPLYKD